MEQPVPIMKMLLVEDNPGDVRLLREAIVEAGSFPGQMVNVGSLSDAFARLQTEHFDVVLLDLSLPDSRGLDTLVRLRKQAPGLPVVVLTGLDDEVLALSAIREGAQDYLVKGRVSGASLVRCLRCAMERQSKASEAPQRSKRGRLLAFLGAKGGTGTTTVALNVAAALAAQDKTVIAVELRPYFGSFAPQLNHVPAANLSSLAWHGPDANLAGDLSSRLYNLRPGLGVLFGPQEVREFAEIGAGEAEALAGALANLADFSVIDLPSQPSPMSEAVIRQCHFASVVVEREPVSVRCGRILVDVLNSWGISQQATGAVVVDKVALFSPMPICDIPAELGCPIVGVAPPAAEALLRANQEGLPLVWSDPKSAAAVALTDIALRVSAHNPRVFGTFDLALRGT